MSEEDFIDTFIPSKDTRIYLHSIRHEFTVLEKATIAANHRMVSNEEKVRWLTDFADAAAEETLRSRILAAISEIKESGREGNDCSEALFDFVYIPHNFRHGDIVRGLCGNFKTEPYRETVGNMGGQGLDYSDVQVRVDIKFDGAAYQGGFCHTHINPIYIERLKLQEDDERRAYLDCLAGSSGLGKSMEGCDEVI